MRTSLTELRQAVHFLQGRLPAEEALLYRSRLLTDPLLRLQLGFLEKAFSVLQLYHRQQLKHEAETLHERLITDPARPEFRAQINQLFQRPA